MCLLLLSLICYEHICSFKGIDHPKIYSPSCHFIFLWNSQKHCEPKLTVETTATNVLYDQLRAAQASLEYYERE